MWRGAARLSMFPPDLSLCHIAFSSSCHIAVRASTYLLLFPPYFLPLSSRHYYFRPLFFPPLFHTTEESATPPTLLQLEPFVQTVTLRNYLSVVTPSLRVRALTVGVLRRSRRRRHRHRHRHRHRRRMPHAAYDDIFPSH
jgi:hypothetical protein